MASRLGFFILTVLMARTIATEHTPELIVWNVGQGQWVTLMDTNFCWHFDTGGEHAPWAAIMRSCRETENRIAYSHWDWDHLSFVRGLANHLPNNCLLLGPVGHSSKRKEAALAGLSQCSGPVPYAAWVDEKGRTSNDKSRVVWWRGILIPGDSTSKEEKFWVGALKEISDTRILILGHHGSAGSTSKILLNHLPRVTAAVASSRFRKYGHPHARVVRDLNRSGIPLLRTEDWGSLHFALE